MVCISYLDISGSPAHLRYLLERLKRRAPGMPVLVGLWPVGEKVLTDAALGRQIGADVYVASLRDGVEACLKAAQTATDSATKPPEQQDGRKLTTSAPSSLRLVP